MRTRLTIVLPALIATLISATPSHGQLIEVEPGYVDLPFLRIQRRYRTRTRVPAPSTAIDGEPGQSPARHPYPYSPYEVYTRTAEPTPAGLHATRSPNDVAAMDWRTLKQTVRAGEAELDKQLRQYGASEHWRKSLHVDALGKLLVSQTNAPPSAELREQLQPILDAYNDASINPASRPVTRLSGFQTVHPALRELLTPPRERQRGRLITASGRLDARLTRMQNGSTWTTHLRLPDSVYGLSGFADDQVALLDEPAEPNLDELMPVLTRFDSVSHDPRYRSVADLPDFQSTFHELSEYIALLGDPLPTTEEPPSATKEPVPTLSREYEHLIRRKSD